MMQCTVDNDLCFLHAPIPGSRPANGDEVSPQRLTAILAKHVDDLKIAGDRAAIVEIRKKIESVFGQLKIEWHTFTNCGMRHIQDAATKEIQLDQIQYIAGIKLVPTTEFKALQDNDHCTERVHALYWSILGAIAFALLTRPDLDVCVGALQRYSQSPKLIHLKRLNAVVKWAQRNSQKLVYWQLDSQVRPAGTTIPTHLRMYSDAAFKKEDDSDTVCVAHFTCVSQEMGNHILSAAAPATSCTMCQDSRGGSRGVRSPQNSWQRVIHKTWASCLRRCSMTCQ
jgi:hypothetical protein